MKKRYIILLIVAIFSIVLFLPFLIKGDILKSKMIEGKSQEEAINIVALETEANTNEIEVVKNAISELDEEVKQNSEDISEIKTSVIVTEENQEENNITIMTEEENLKKELEDIDKRLSDSSLLPLEINLLNMKKQMIEYKLQNPNWYECQERQYLLNILKEYLDISEEDLKDLRYTDIDFNECLKNAENNLNSLKEKLSSLEETEENNSEIQMLTRQISTYHLEQRVENILNVKRNLKDLEDKCFSK